MRRYNSCDGVVDLKALLYKDKLVRALLQCNFQVRFLCALYLALCACSHSESLGVALLHTPGTYLKPVLNITYIHSKLFLCYLIAILTLRRRSYFWIFIIHEMLNITVLSKPITKNCETYWLLAFEWTLHCSMPCSNKFMNQIGNQLLL